jgi:hypothetical protein
MTHDAKLRLRGTGSKIVSNLLLAFVAALGTHYLDVLAVRDRVENIRAEQIENTKWRIESQVHIKQIDENQQSLLNGQYLLNKRLCRFLVEHGAADKECTSALYMEEQTTKEVTK